MDFLDRRRYALYSDIMFSARSAFCDKPNSLEIVKIVKKIICRQPLLSGN